MPSVGYATLQVIPSVRGIGDEIRRQMVGPAANAGQQAGQAAGSGLSNKLKVGAAAAGVAAGALLVKGLADAIGQANVTSQMQAQLGTTTKVAAAQGKIAGELYSSGVAESFQGAADAIKAVVQAGLAPPDATNAQLQQIATKASDVANVFGQDLGGVTNAVSQMMRTGLAKSSTEAFDLITRGFQSGADKGGDLLDTINEYGVQFKKAGLTGADALGLINQAIRAGARDSDVAADAIKEFGIRAVDGSKTSAEGFKMLGLNADDMAKKFAQGGSAANGVLDLTLDRLRGIRDPIQQSQAAAALFGTQAEDLGAGLLAMDPSKAAGKLGSFAGAADKAGKTLRSGPSHEIELFTRALQQGLVDFLGGKVLPVLGRLGGWVNTNVLPPLSAVASVVGAALVPVLSGLWKAGMSVVNWLQSMGTWLIPIGIAVGGLTIAMSAQAIAAGTVAAVFSLYRGAILAWTAVQRGATIAQAAFNLVMNANPVVLVITAILALGAALVVAYQKSETFRNIVQGAWEGIKTAAMFVWNSVLKPAFAGLVAAFQAIGAAASWLWTTVLQPVFSFIGTAAKILATVIGVIVIGPIIIAVKVLGAVFRWLWTAVLSPVIGWIVAGFKLLWAGLQPVFAFVRGAIEVLGTIAKWLWTNVLSPVISWIVAGFKLWWASLKPIFGFVKDAFKAIGTVAKWLWTNVLSPVIGWIVSLFKTWWASIKIQFGYIKAGFGAIGDAAKWLWKNAIKPVLGWIADKAKWLWNNALKPAFDWIKNGISKVGDSFRAAKDFIKKAWNQVQEIAKKPVRFIIGTVYNKGIVPTWNLIADAFGAPKIKQMSLKGFRSGGPVHGPGTETSDSIPSLLSRNEHVWTGKEVRGAGGHGVILAMRRAAASGQLGQMGLPGFKDGGGFFGWVGSAANTVAGWGTAAWDKVKEGASWLADSIEASARAGVRAVVNPLLSALPGADTGFGKMVRRIPDKALDAIFGYSKEADGKGASYSSADIGGSGVERWSKVVLHALKMLRQPASLLPVVLRRMNQESGGNPRAINNWDVNAKNGDPSRGLMQTIGSTFNAYAGKLRGRGIYDPLANVYASMRYALWRYGSLSSAYNRAGGYAAGGRPRAGELAWVGERGPELVRFGGGSRVYDHRTSLAIAGTASRAAAARAEAGASWRAAVGPGAGRAGDGAPVVVEVHTRDEALADFIEVKVKGTQRRVTSVVRAGRSR